MRSELVEFQQETLSIEPIPVDKMETFGKLALGTSFPQLAVVRALWNAPVSCPDSCLAFVLALTNTEYGHWGPTPCLFLVLRCPLTQKLQALLYLFLLENCHLPKELLPTSQFDWKVSLERPRFAHVILRLTGFLFQTYKNCFM